MDAYMCIDVLLLHDSLVTKCLKILYLHTALLILLANVIQYFAAQTFAHVICGSVTITFIHFSTVV